MSWKIVDRSRWSRTLIETNFQQKKLNNCFDRIRAMMEYKVKLLFFFFFTLSLFPNLVLLFLSTMYFFFFLFFFPDVRTFVHTRIETDLKKKKKKRKNGGYLERTIFFNRLLHFLFIPLRISRVHALFFPLIFFVSFSLFSVFRVRFFFLFLVKMLHLS